jgi:hypothetical protein
VAVAMNGIWVIGEVFVFIVWGSIKVIQHILVQSSLVVGAIQICNVVLKVLLSPRALILPAIQLVFL